MNRLIKILSTVSLVRVLFSLGRPAVPDTYLSQKPVFSSAEPCDPAIQSKKTAVFHRVLISLLDVTLTHIGTDQEDTSGLLSIWCWKCGLI